MIVVASEVGDVLRNVVGIRRVRVDGSPSVVDVLVSCGDVPLIDLEDGTTPSNHVANRVGRFPGEFTIDD